MLRKLIYVLLNMFYFFFLSEAHCYYTDRRAFDFAFLPCATPDCVLSSSITSTQTSLRVQLKSSSPSLCARGDNISCKDMFFHGLNGFSISPHYTAVSETGETPRFRSGRCRRCRRILLRNPGAVHPVKLLQSKTLLESVTI